MASLTTSDLASWFMPPKAAQQEQIGIEVELGVVDPSTGLSIPYEGERGVRTLLEALLHADDEPVLDGGHLMGIKRADGTQLTLEAGGGLEYSSPPATSLAVLTDAMRHELDAAAEIAHHHDMALLSGGNLAFNTSENATWVPKPRLPIMRRYFAALGDCSALSDSVMALTLSTQVTLDYCSEEDLSRKLRMQMAVSPIVAALFANSPLEAGRYSGSLSRRTQYWLKHDPRRSGFLPFALQEHITIHEIIEWALELSMIYRCKGSQCKAGSNRTFASLMAQGFDDGTLPTLSDWVSHLSQVWPHVRVRDTLELRVADGPAYQNIPALPAFWTGLTYHPPSRDAAWDLLRGCTRTELRHAMHEVAVKGLATHLRKDAVHELAIELVRLAKQGLSARIEAGLEAPNVLAHLEPIEEVAAAGKTFAETCIERWEGEFQHRPDRYVAAYRL